jgi:hypothetical protein
MPFQYLPSYAFKKYCSGITALNARSEYPRDLRNLYFELKRHENLLDRLLDLKNIKKGYSKG